MMRNGGDQCRHTARVTVLQSWIRAKLRPILTLLSPLLIFFLLFLSLAFSPTGTSTFFVIFSYNPLQLPSQLINSTTLSQPAPKPSTPVSPRDTWKTAKEEMDDKARKKEEEIRRGRVAICLVGGARRFELTGPSITKNLLDKYPEADLFLHSPLDRNSYKLSLLKSATRIAAVRIFAPQPIEETDLYKRMLTSVASPNGIQGLMQYFNLVEGCLRLIEAQEAKGNFTYDWIVRTRVDGYWSGELDPDYFRPGIYVVPNCCQSGGLNDRFGVGDRNTSAIALSRLSLIPLLDTARSRRGHLNSEAAFKAQLLTFNVTWKEVPMRFCVVTDRQYPFPPHGGVPVMFMGVKWPLSGNKCRPCEPPLNATTAGPKRKSGSLEERWKGIRQICNASGGWEEGWEKVFSQVAGVEGEAERRRVAEMGVASCVADFEAMKKKALTWEAPPAEDICNFGLGQTKSTL